MSETEKEITAFEENKRIIIIDDDPGVIDTYLDIFSAKSGNSVISKGNSLFNQNKDMETIGEPTPYEITTAENGEQGIEKIKEAVSQNKPFAVAFVDMKMPGINGAETAKKIWELDPLVKIVIITAFSEYTPEDIVRQTKREDIFYLRKPFNHEEVMQFARALTNEWNLEKKSIFLKSRLNQANKKLQVINKNLKGKVQKQASRIVQSEKMASVGLLAAGVAHEINNPITFINSNLTLLRKNTEKIALLYEKYQNIESFIANSCDTKENPVLQEIIDFKKDNDFDFIIEDLEDLLGESINGIDRIKTIVHDLKNFSRINQAEEKQIDINDAIETTLKILKNEISENITIEKNYGDIPDLKCQPRKINQVLMNIILNAIQAIEEQGKVKISTILTKNSDNKGKKYIEISISDSGVGIPKENLTKLFEPFFTTKPVGTGTGLGLSVVYEIVKLHKGNIEVKSREGKGTMFIIQLPF